MARKTMVELLATITANFPNNTTGEISPTDLRQFCTDFVDTVTPAYGILAITAPMAQVVGVTDQVLPWLSEYLVQAPEFTTTPATGIVRRTQNIVVNDIKINIDVEMATNRECLGTLYANGVATIWRGKVSGNGPGRPAVLSIEATNYSAVPVDYQLRVQCDQAGTPVTFSNGVFLVEAIPVRQAL